MIVAALFAHALAGSVAIANVQPVQNVVQIEAGGSFSCLLNDVGEVKCWGLNSIGQMATGELGDVTGERRIPLPRKVDGLQTPVRQIALGGSHACALSDAGSVACWGSNSKGQLGDGTITNSFSTGAPTPLSVAGLPADITSLSTGAAHTCALSVAGGVFCWGQNASGELGDGTFVDRGTAAAVSGLASGVVSIHAASGFTCALTDAGSVKCWGGVLGNGTGDSSAVPVDVTGFDGPVSMLAAKDGHACATTSSGAWCWGFNWAGQLGLGTVSETPTLSPVAVIELDAPPQAITMGNGFTCVIDEADFVRCWGRNNYGQLGNGRLGQASTILDRSDLSERLGRVRNISAGMFHVCAVDWEGNAHCWGSNSASALGDGSVADHSLPVAVLGRPDVATALAAGYNHTCALSGDGSVYCWGVNTYGQLGDGSTERRGRAVVVASLPQGIRAIDAGGYSTCALTAQGGVLCWGDNRRGQLGDGTIEQHSTPVQVVGLDSGVDAITVGISHACAVMQDGGLKCWGANTYGSLGNGAFSDSSSPVDVSGLEDRTIASASAGSHVTCATTVAGAALCWGRNDLGQLGDGTQATRATPAGVSGLASGVRSVQPSAPTHTCALTTAGGIKCWGLDNYGQLGLPSPGYYSFVPAGVAGLEGGVEQLNTGYGANCVILESATVRCWGNLIWGVVGYDNSRHPEVVDQPALTNTTALTIGSRHACAIRDGHVDCWGYRGDGEIGDGTTAQKPLPVDVLGATPPPGIFLLVDRGDDGFASNKGSSATRSYRIRATNYGVAEVRGVRLRVPVPDGLADVSWTCGATSVACTPASGSGVVDLVVDLAPEQSVLVHLVGDVAPDAMFVRIGAEVRLPSGAVVSNTQGDYAVHVEAVGLGVFGSGFE